jgi:hypothetical protein
VIARDRKEERICDKSELQAEGERERWKYRGKERKKKGRNIQSSSQAKERKNERRTYEFENDNSVLHLIGNEVLKEEESSHEDLILHLPPTSFASFSSSRASSLPYSFSSSYLSLSSFFEEQINALAS